MRRESFDGHTSGFRFLEEGVGAGLPEFGQAPAVMKVGGYFVVLVLQGVLEVQVSWELIGLCGSVRQFKVCCEAAKHAARLGTSVGILQDCAQELRPMPAVGNCRRTG